MTAIALLLMPGGFAGIFFYDAGLVAIYIALTLAVVSGIKLTVSFWRQI